MEQGRSAALRMLAIAGHVAVAIAVTAPLAWRLGSLPLGHEPAATVPQFNLWTLRWTADRLPHALAGWWDAPIFWPTRGTFAFSEPQPLTGLAFAVVRHATGPVAGYGVVLISTVALNGIAGSAMARRLGASAVVAFGTGVLAQALPFVFRQLGVLQLVGVWPLLALLACVVAWLEEPRLRHAVLGALAFAAAVFTCGYYALLTAMCLVVAVPIVLGRSWGHDRRRRVGSALVAMGVGALVVLPLVVGQARRLAGRRWSDATIAAGSASTTDWLPGGRLWPGLPLLAAGTIGTVLGWRDRRIRLLAVAATVALLASFGSHLVVLGVRPWNLLTDHLDAVARLRSPYRAAVLVQVALTGLAVPVLQRLWDLGTTSKRAAVAAVVAASILVSGAGPGRLVAPPPEPGAWARRLAAAGDGADAAVVTLPFAAGGRVADFEPTTARMLQALNTDHPLLNGYSGFFPADEAEVAAALRGWPDARSTDLLERRQVRYVVVSTPDFDAIDRRIARRLGYRVLVHDDDAWLLLAPAPDGAPAAP